MRGKGKKAIWIHFISGITPAYAGKSVVCIEFEEFCRDHPRLCGEKGFGTPPHGRLPGSPPPMRGKGDAAV